jgi:hypothetical protein
MCWSIGAVLAAVLTMTPPAGADGNHHHVPACEPGYTLVPEVTYVEVCRKVCKLVPDVRETEKWVYSCKSEDLCFKKCPLHGLHTCAGCEQCGACVQCDKPVTRNRLVKRLVVEECPSVKCVVERVPCVVYRKVPCGFAPSPAPEMLPAPKPPPAGAASAPGATRPQ